MTRRRWPIGLVLLAGEPAAAVNAATVLQTRQD